MSKKFFNRTLFPIVFSIILFSISNTIKAQQKLSDFVVYAGPTPTGTGVTLIGSSITVNGGIVGAYKLVQTTGNTTINADLYSADRIVLTNSNIVTGKIVAGNSSNSATAISIGSSATLGDNINDSILAKGGINIGGGTVAGIVRLPLANFPYIGPVPASGPSAVVYSDPYIPAPPVMPSETSFSGGSGTVTNNQTYGPGTYGTINYSGNKTLTLKAPLNSSGSYIYYFKAFTWTGNSNKLVFDFNGGNGKFFIYVEGNTDFGKLNANVIGGNASQILVETHGNGIGTSIPGNSFIIANGSSGGGSKWFGTVYATRAGINIGSGTGSSTLTGALYSATNVSIQSGVTMVYGAFNPCSAPNANAGVDRPFKFASLDTLIGTSTTPGVSFNWEVLNGSGGVIASADHNNDSISISASGSYILTVTNGAASCFTKDTVVIAAKVPDLIGAELLSIYRNKTTSSPFFFISNGKVLIDVIAIKGKYDSALLKLQSLGFTPPFGLPFATFNGESAFFQTGEIPVDSLLKINNLGSLIKYCRPYYQPFTFNAFNTGAIRDSTKTGLVISQGDTMLRTNLVRPGFRINGNGIKIGVISDSYGTIPNGTVAIPPYQPVPGPIPQTFNTTTVRQDIINGDVPADTTIQIVSNTGALKDTTIQNPQGFARNVHVLQDFPALRSDEGRAMIQIIQDVAPAAEIYFNSGFFTAGEFAKTIKRLRDAGCKIIVDDVSYPTEPFMRDGIIAKTADSVVRISDVTYISSAGNFADQSYESDFNPTDASSLIGFSGLKAHNFGSGDKFQQIMLRPGKYQFVFQWLDSIYSSGEITGTHYNMDCYLSRQTDGGGLIGFNRDNTGGDPIEFIPIDILPDYPNDTTSKPYNLLIINNTITGNPARIKYIIFKRDANANIGFINHREGAGVSVSTIMGQANADSVISVGASRFNHTIDRYTGIPHPLLPANLIGITKPQLESFSSVGGTRIEGNIRNKPNLVGADGGDVTVKLGQDYPNNALNGYSNFFGTSAAAPHVAAAAALIMQGRKKFLVGHPDTKPWEVRNLFQSTAFDMESPGYDLKSGYGLVDADSAMRIFASPTPFEIKLVVPEDVVPGQTQFQLTITGQNFSNNSYVVIGDTTLVNGVRDTTQYWPDAINRNQILVTLNTFDGNPPVMVYTPPKTAFEDGGFSNILYFFNGKVVVQAVNATMKYGQNVPFLDTIITINDTLLQNSRYTLAQIGLAPLQVTTSANQFSEVGPQSINVSRVFNINDPADSAFLKNFSYKFIDGTLTVGKMPLKVTPNDITVTSGDAIANLTFKYEFDPLYPPANPAALKDTAKKYHQAFLPANALAVVKDFKKTQTGGYILSDADLTNMNMMTSFKALKNSRKFRIENGKLVPRGNTDSLDSYYLLDIASESIFDYTGDSSKTNFYTGYPGYTKKGLLNEAALKDGHGQATTTNGTLAPMINGNLAPMLNGNLASYLNASLAPMINGNLVSYLNGTLATLVNGVATPIPNSPLVYLLNGGLAQYLNGTLAPLINGSLVTLLNGAGTITITDANSYVIIANSDGVLHMLNGGLAQYLNGNLAPLINAKDVVILPNGSLATLINGNLAPLINGNLVSFLNGSLATYLNGTTLAPIINSGLATLLNTTLVSFLNGTLVSYLNADGSSPSSTPNNTAVIIDETDVDPTTNNYLGALFGINMITGLGEGTQTMVAGTLVNPNFDVSYGYGHALIKPDSACLLTHSTAKNITNTAQVPTTMWLSMTTKVSGQLSAVGDSLLFRSGSITFNFVNSTPTVLNMPVPNGMILAIDVPIQTPPSTSWNVSRNMWITTVPKNFASTSDIFVTGALIPSTNGFTKLGGNTNSVMKGMFFSNKTFTDQWGYGLAPYLGTTFNYDPTLKNPDDVIAINGNYRAGTPVPLIPYYAGTGNAYTGTFSSFDKFTACPSPVVLQNRQVSTSELLITQGNKILEPSVAIYPNPASASITLSIVPLQTGSARIEVYTINGTKVMETNDGIYESGARYLKQLNVGKLVNGMYLVRIWNGNSVTNRKVVIHR